MAINEPRYSWIFPGKLWDDFYSGFAEKNSQRVVERLRRIAEKRVAEQATYIATENDVIDESLESNEAISAFFLRIRGPLERKVFDRDQFWEVGFWELLATLTINTARKYSLNECSSLKKPKLNSAVLLAEALCLLFAEVDAGEPKEILLHRLEGGSNTDIATRIGRSEATVERRLKLIRSVLTKLTEFKTPIRGGDDDLEPPGAVVAPSPAPQNPGGALGQSQREPESDSNSG